jgi:hypothetical protein
MKLQQSFQSLAPFTLALQLTAVQTREIVHQGQEAFSKGELQNLTLSEDGILTTGPAIETIAELDSAIIWSAAQAPNGTLFIATGNKGKIISIDPKGEKKTIFEPEEMLARAMALGEDGSLYVGTSPNGRIYRIPGPGSRAEIYFDPSETYIWDLKFDKDGALFVATGNRGRIYKLSPEFKPGDKPELWYEDVAAHFVNLSFDNNGHLLAGSDPDGNVYRLTEPFEGKVLYNSNGGEIRKIHQLEDGDIYFSTFKGAAKSSEPENKEGESDSAKAKSIFYKVKSDGFVEVFWRNPEEPIYSFDKLGDKGWVVGTGNKGRLFHVRPDGKWSLLQTLEDGGEVTAILTDKGEKGGHLLFTSNPARVYRLTAKPAQSGTLTSEVLDVKQVSKWGRIHTLPDCDKLEIQTRGGNTEKVTGAWSDWEGLGETGHIPGSSTRYRQYRVQFKSEDSTLARVRLFYQINNTAPIVRNINVVPNGYVVTSQKAVAPILTLDKLTKGNISEDPPQPPVRQQLAMTPEDSLQTAGWDAGDPNGDELRFRLEYRRLPETEEWFTLATDVEDPVYTFTTQGMEDGYYQMKVTASDHLSNPPGTAQTNFLVSSQFLVDNSSPRVLAIPRTNADSGNIAQIDITIKDNFSVLTSAEYILDGAKTATLFPDDLLLDDTKETFTLPVPKGLRAGTHSLIINATDDRGNKGTKQLTFQTN